MDIWKNRYVLVTSNPKGLLRKVWFDVMLGIGRCGREIRGPLPIVPSLSNEMIVVFVEMVASETTRNHRGLCDNDFERSPHIYAKNTPACPVYSFELYLSKRNPNSANFFQLPKCKCQNSDDGYYTRRPIGEQILNDMKKYLSKDAAFTNIYTNHCVRATALNMVAHSGVPDVQIMRITGHKCEASLSSYNTDSSNNQEEMLCYFVRS